jgi:hypothetical protein
MNCTFAHGDNELRQPYEELPEQAIQRLRYTNPNAFHLLNVQAQSLKPRLLLTDEHDSITRGKIIEANQLLQCGKQDIGLHVV